MTNRRCRILPANALLVLIGLADLLTTAFWLQTGQAVEMNPIMAAVLRAGIVAFVLVKLSTLAAYTAVMEWYRRRRNAAFAHTVGRITVAAYIAVYAVCFFSVNSQLILN